MIWGAALGSFCPAAACRGFLADFFGALVSAAAPPTLLRSASIKSTTFSPRGRAPRRDRLARALAVDQVYERRLIVVLELFRFEVPRCTSPSGQMAAGSSSRIEQGRITTKVLI